MDICPDLPFNMAPKCSVTPEKEDAERNISMSHNQLPHLRTTSEFKNHDQESAKNITDDDGLLDCNLTT
jgi:hypothetical protein